MLKENPIISIILPTYNVGKYINRCIESCINQTSKDFEIVVVDDCGEDDSIQRVREWMQRDKRIRVIINERNLGTYHSRRIGVENAKGRYIVFLDPDDALHESTVELITEVVSIHKVDMVFFGVHQDPPPKWWFQTLKVPSEVTVGCDIKKKILKTCNLNYGTAGKVYYRDVLIDAYDVIDVKENVRLVYAEDVLLFYVLLNKAVDIKCINKKLYIYHANGQSITNVFDDDNTRLKCGQIDSVISLIEDASKKISLSGDCSSVDYVTKRITDKLLSDKYILSRFSIDDNGKKVYLGNVYNSFLNRRSFADLVRITVFIFSFGCVRL